MDATNGTSPHAEAAVDDAEGRRPLGEIFVELGFVTRDELDEALAEQLRTGVRLGEILVEQGSLTRLDLATALAEHWEPHSYPQNGGAAHGQGQNGAAAREPLAGFVEPPVADAYTTATRVSAAESAVAELAARLDALAVLVTGLRADVSGVVERDDGEDRAELAALRVETAALHGETAALRVETAALHGETAALHVETASLGGRFDELLGLRHADAHGARAAAERLDGRLTALATRQADDAQEVRAALTAARASEGLAGELEALALEVAGLGRRLDRESALAEERARARCSRGQPDPGGREERQAGQAPAPLDRRARRLDRGRGLAARCDRARHPTAPGLTGPRTRLRPAGGGPQVGSTAETGLYLRPFCFAIAPATRSPVMNMWL